MTARTGTDGPPIPDTLQQKVDNVRALSLARDHERDHLEKLLWDYGYDRPNPEVVSLHRSPELVDTAHRARQSGDVDIMRACFVDIQRARRQPAPIDTTPLDLWGKEAYTQHGDAEIEPTSWAPIDLAEYVGKREPPPDVLRREDNNHLLYRGKTHAIVGESESCKSWFCAVAVAQAISDGKRCLWLDYEDSPTLLIERLESLGLTSDQYLPNLVYVQPSEPLMYQHKRNGGALEKTRAYTDDFLPLIQDEQFTLAIVDAITDSMGMEGLDLLDNADAATWRHRIADPIANETGAAVLSIDHVTKAREGRGRYGMGAATKLNGLTGCMFTADVVEPFYRADRDGDPVDGRVAIRVGKDRAGYVRRCALPGMDSSNTQMLLDLRLTSWPCGEVRAGLRVPEDEAVEGASQRALMAAVADYIRDHPGCNTEAIIGGVQGKGSQAKRHCIAHMVEEGIIDVAELGGRGNKKAHTLSQHGRDRFPATD